MVVEFWKCEAGVRGSADRAVDAERGGKWGLG